MPMDIAAQKPGDNGRQAPRKPTARSRVSNGRDLLPGIDGRTIIARRYRDITAAILTDQAGADQCSEARLQLVRRFAATAVLAEEMEARLANGEQISIEQHATLSSTLVRLASRIGIDRRQRDVTPTLAEYLASHASEDSEAADVGEPDEAWTAAETKTHTSGHGYGSAAPPMSENGGT